jgi:polyisoprenoid-binding protein YceI
MTRQIATATATATAAIALSTIPPAHAASAAAPVRWEVDSGHSTAAFKVRHLMVSNVRGTLGPVSGTVELDDRNPTRSRVAVSIDARAIDSKDPKRDEHLRSADFLDVAHFPSVTFRSTEVRPTTPAGSLAVTGELSIRGVSRPVTLTVDPLPSAVQDPWGNTKRGAVARTSLSRKDWGLVWNLALETGGVVVGDRVDIEIEVELVRRDPPASKPGA